MAFSREITQQKDSFPSNQKIRDVRAFNSKAAYHNQKRWAKTGDQRHQEISLCIQYSIRRSLKDSMQLKPLVAE
jgi:hypothetical protein